MGTCSSGVKEMNYKSYLTKEKAPSRMSRKRARRDIFVFNKKAKKLLLKQRRFERQQLES
jgi:hypothetical protein